MYYKTIYPINNNKKLFPSEIRGCQIFSYINKSKKLFPSEIGVVLEKMYLILINNKKT